MEEEKIIRKIKKVNFHSIDGFVVDLNEIELDVTLFFRSVKKAGFCSDISKLNKISPSVKISSISVEVPENHSVSVENVVIPKEGLNCFCSILEARKIQVNRAAKNKSGSLYTGRVSLIRTIDKSEIFRMWVFDGMFENWIPEPTKRELIFFK